MLKTQVLIFLRPLAPKRAPNINRRIFSVYSVSSVYPVGINIPNGRIGPVYANRKSDINFLFVTNRTVGITGSVSRRGGGAVRPIVIAVLNFKGGIGKTTTAVNSAYALSLRGWPVLLIDIDERGQSTTHLGLEKDSGSGLYNVLLEKKGSIADLAQPTAFGVDIIPEEHSSARCSPKVFRTIS